MPQLSAGINTFAYQTVTQTVLRNSAPVYGSNTVRSTNFVCVFSLESELSERNQKVAEYRWRCSSHAPRPTSGLALRALGKRRGVFFVSLTEPLSSWSEGTSDFSLVHEVSRERFAEKKRSPVANARQTTTLDLYHKASYLRW